MSENLDSDLIINSLVRVSNGETISEAAINEILRACNIAFNHEVALSTANARADIAEAQFREAKKKIEELEQALWCEQGKIIALQRLETEANARAEQAAARSGLRDIEQYNKGRSDGNADLKEDADDILTALGLIASGHSIGLGREWQVRKIKQAIAQLHEAREEIAGLRKALEPFARKGRTVTGEDDEQWAMVMRVGDLRAARDAVAGLGEASS